MTVFIHNVIHKHVASLSKLLFLFDNEHQLTAVFIDNVLFVQNVFRSSLVDV